jgi:hypothetical protein
VSACGFSYCTEFARNGYSLCRTERQAGSVQFPPLLPPLVEEGLYLRLSAEKRFFLLR